jgi:regulator of RNase E activity RraA
MIRNRRNEKGENIMFKTDQDIFDFMRQNLYVPVVSDILDSLGYRNQAMHPRLRPLLPDMRACGLVGRARTVRWMETDYVVEEDPYGGEIDVVDSLKPGDVIVHSTDASGTIAPWGELMSTIAKRNGCVGCVCDAMIRDCVRIVDMGFPVYYAGIGPLDSKGRGRVQAYDVPIRCGGVLVHPRDLIFADYDGIVVIPQAVEQDVFAQAMEKVGKENLTREALLAGKSLREVYNTYHIL